VEYEDQTEGTGVNNGGSDGGSRSATVTSHFTCEKDLAMNNCNTRQHHTTLGISTIACITVLGTVFTLAVPAAAHAQVVTPPVPAGLEVPAGNVPFLLGRGVGTQNYECQPANTIGQVAWILFTPQATLFSDSGEQLTTHFFSPNPDEAGVLGRVAWQDSQDTSTVWARAIAIVDDPTGSGAIPWVKLEAVGKRPGPTGGNTLTVTTFIQRLNTVGGSAPPTGCDLPTDIGRKAFVPYTADYFFYRKN
jgi:Protein of unknown function (DUF3455)